MINNDLCVNVNATVYKSRFLTYLRDDDFPLPVLKLLDVILSKIEPSNPSKTHIRIYKCEFEKAIGVKRLRPEVADKYLTALSMPVSIRSVDNKKNFVKVPLFIYSKSVAEEKTGKWYFDFIISPVAYTYFFNIDNLGFIKYTLSNTVKLSSKYSFYLFTYISLNLFRGEWTVSTSDLQEFFHCNNEYYAEFFQFKSKILDPAIKEVNEKTDIQVSYKKNNSAHNKTVSLNFKAYSSGGESEIVRKTKIAYLENNKDRINKIKTLTGLPDEDCITICEKMYSNILSDEDAFKIIEYAVGRKKIDNLCGYIISLMDKGFIEPTRTKYKNKFSNYHQSITEDEIKQLEFDFGEEVNNSNV